MSVQACVCVSEKEREVERGACEVLNSFLWMGEKTLLTFLLFPGELSLETSVLTSLSWTIVDRCGHTTYRPLKAGADSFIFRRVIFELNHFSTYFLLLHLWRSFTGLNFENRYYGNISLKAYTFFQCENLQWHWTRWCWRTFDTMMLKNSHFLPSSKFFSPFFSQNSPKPCCFDNLK